MSRTTKSPAGRYAVFAGLDVAKGEHHLCALDPAGIKLYDRALPNDEDALAEALNGLRGRGEVLVVIDQPASIGALTIAVARDLGIDVAYLPGLTMRRLADLHPGEGKTDARDAYVIADAARTMPHTLRQVGGEEELLVGLAALAGYDDDLVAQATRLSNRIRDALLHIHPALERVLGPQLHRGGVVDLLASAPTPVALQELGVAGIATLLHTHSPRLAKTLPEKIQAALNAQRVVVPATAEYGRVISGLAAQLRDIRTERAVVAVELEERLDKLPLAEVLSSMPGVGLRTSIKILTIVGDGSAFPTAAHLAAYAGLAPVTRRSGSSIRGETRSYRGHHALKSALYLSAFASLSDPASRLLRPETSRGQAAPSRPRLPRPTAHRRPLRHAPRPHSLQPTACPRVPQCGIARSPTPCSATGPSTGSPSPGTSSRPAPPPTASPAPADSQQRHPDHTAHLPGDPG